MNLNLNLSNTKNQYESKKLKEYKELLLLYNLKWKNKDCNWSDSNANYLKNISDTKLKNLYDALILSSKDLTKKDYEFDRLISEMLKKETNIQNNIKTMKKLYNAKNHKNREKDINV